MVFLGCRWSSSQRFPGGRRALGVLLGAEKQGTALFLRLGAARSRPLASLTPGLSKGATAGIAIAAVVILGLILGLSIGIYRTRKIKMDAVILPTAPDKSLEHDQGVVSASDKLEFSYEELAKATNDFSMANKIGQGGFGAVYYAELREVFAELKRYAKSGQ